MNTSPWFEYRSCDPGQHTALWLFHQDSRQGLVRVPLTQGWGWLPSSASATPVPSSMLSLLISSFLYSYYSLHFCIICYCITDQSQISMYHHGAVFDLLVSAGQEFWRNVISFHSQCNTGCGCVFAGAVMKVKWFPSRYHTRVFASLNVYSGPAEMIVQFLSCPVLPY